MRFIVARMIANGSLAAFSALAQPAVHPVVHPAARPESQPSPIRMAAAPARAPEPLPAVRPGQPLPRGSLLDLKV